MDETSRAGITPGLANAVQRGRLSDYACTGCGFGFPVYTGRYPSACPRCSGTVERRKTRQRPVAEAEKALDPTKAQIAVLRQQQQIIGQRMVRARKQGNTPPRQMAIMAQQKATVALRQATLVAQQPADETSRGSMEDRAPTCALCKKQGGKMEPMAVGWGNVPVHAACKQEYAPKFNATWGRNAVNELRVAKALAAWRAGKFEDVCCLGCVGGGPCSRAARDEGKGEVACTSMVPRIKALIDAGAASTLPHAGDPFCSRTRTVSMTEVEKMPGGVAGLRAFFEERGGRFFRMEGPTDPVLVLEGDLDTMRMFATSAPSAYIGFDPRAEMVDLDVSEALGRPDLVAYARTILSGLDMDDEGTSPEAAVLTKAFRATVARNEPAHGVAVAASRLAAALDAENATGPSASDLRDLVRQLGYNPDHVVAEGVVESEVSEPELGRDYLLHGTQVGAGQYSVGVEFGEVRPGGSVMGAVVVNGMRVGVNPDDDISASDAQRILAGITHLVGGSWRWLPGFWRAADHHASEWSRTVVGRFPPMGNPFEIAEDAAAPTGKSVLAPRPDTGDGAQRAHGGFRFTIGKNQKPEVRTDVARSLQNTRNSKRGVASRVKAAKEWHRSAEGQSFHRDLGRYNKGNHRGGQDEATGFFGAIKTKAQASRVVKALVAKGETSAASYLERDWMAVAARPVDAEKIVRLAGLAREFGLTETFETSVALAEDYGPNSSGYTHGMPGYNERTVDDVFQGILRKLVVIESLDILQDVEFTDEGGIYLMFDPSLPRREIEDIVQVLREGNDKLALAGAPDGSMGAPADWWLVFLPGPTEGAGTPAPPQQNPLADPNATPGANEPPKKQMVIPAKTAIGNLAAGLDIDAALKGM